jgi:tRNA modification GTPase
MPEDTICASATPPINSPISVIRISGPDTYRAVKSIFNHTEKIRHRTAVYGSVIHKDELIDDVVLVYYESPNSFTGEDMAEISCHGSPIIVRKIIRILHELGIKIAEPGEFSKRSFLNGKIDLTEAEAINHIITARSDWEVSAAIKQMHGALHNKVNAIRDLIIHLKADIEAGIDFIEENIEFISYEDAIIKLNEIKALLKDLQKRCRIGEKISHGIDIPIVGRPNVGKSSILNLILNRERAIVSDIPGTTRDIINEIVQFAGVPVNLMDTAGITDTNCVIEQKGIELSGKKIETASIVIVVIDAGSGVTDSDLEIIESIKNKKAIILANKIDLVSDRNKAMSLIEKKTGKVIQFSAKTGEGLSLLEESVAEIFKNEFVDYNNSFIADMRVINILEKAVSIIEEAERLLLLKEPQEILAFLLQSLIDCFSEIIGEISPDDVLNSIFSRFCIGK